MPEEQKKGFYAKPGLFRRIIAYVNGTSPNVKAAIIGLAVPIIAGYFVLKAAGQKPVKNNDRSAIDLPPSIIASSPKLSPPVISGLMNTTPPPSSSIIVVATPQPVPVKRKRYIAVFPVVVRDTLPEDLKGLRFEDVRSRLERWASASGPVVDTRQLDSIIRQRKIGENRFTDPETRIEIGRVASAGFGLALSIDRAVCERETINDGINIYASGWGADVALQVTLIDLETGLDLDTHIYKTEGAGFQSAKTVFQAVLEKAVLKFEQDATFQKKTVQHVKISHSP